MLSWARFWARYIDVFVVSMIVVVIITLIFPVVATWNNYATELVALPVALFLLAIIQCAFGTTLGKLVAGIRVQRESGERLNLGTALNREVSVYVSGLALGLPIICLFTMGSSYNSLRNDGATTYDREHRTKVVSCGSNPLRTWLTCLVYLIGVGSLVALGQLKTQDTSRLQAAAPGAADSTPSLADQLKQSAAELKLRLPMQIDRVTKLVDASAKGTMYTYSYEAQLTTDQFNEYSGDIQEGARRKYCGMDNSLFRKLGVIQIYDYSTPQHEHLGSFTLQPGMCAPVEGPANTTG